MGHYHQGFVNVLVIGSLIAMLADGVGRLEPLVGIFLAFYWLYNRELYTKVSNYVSLSW